jgi:hypothetical protein
MTKLTLYVPEEMKGLVKKAKEVFKRENKSLSEYLLNCLSGYVKLHEPGNPQQRLDTIIKIGKAYRAGCCVDCGRPAEMQVFKEKEDFLYCRWCYEENTDLKYLPHKIWKKKVRV